MSSALLARRLFIHFRRSISNPGAIEKRQNTLSKKKTVVHLVLQN